LGSFIRRGVTRKKRITARVGGRGFAYRKKKKTTALYDDKGKRCWGKGGGGTSDKTRKTGSSS